MTGLTETRVERYVNNNPNSCPYCEDSDGHIVNVGEPFRASDFSIWQESKCQECDNEWYDVYHLVDIQEKEATPWEESKW